MLSIEEKLEKYEVIKCPECKNTMISIIETYQISHERNIRTGKIISKDYGLSPFGRVFHNYKCRKCGWMSENYDE